MKVRSSIKTVAIVIAGLLITASIFYGFGRLYFAVTGGFTIGNITSDRTFDERWQTRPLSDGEKQEIHQALDQEYTYLGKGCQAYVFASRDGKYVIKFFKYQRFRPQSWLNLFTFIPAIDRYQKAKAVEKNKKLEKVFRSWKIAFDQLKNETGVVYVHLNKSNDLNQELVIHDKMGQTHVLHLDDMEFLLQHRASMFCPTIDSLVHSRATLEAEQLIDNLMAMLLSEYSRGYADNDHALMQNTGVFKGHPIHIDVGQFIYNEIVKDPKVFKQEIYDKTYKLQRWLASRHPDLAMLLKSRLVAMIGIDYFYMGPYVHKGDVGKISHQE